MRKAPKKKGNSNKFVLAFVIILVLITIFFASFIISFNLMGNSGNGDALNDTKVTDEYEQPEDLLGGKKSDNDKLADLRKENAELKEQVSSLEVENTELRNEIKMLNATLENQSFVKNNASSSEGTSQSEASGSSTVTDPSITSDTGL